jgi:hypothetical protein
MSIHMSRNCQLASDEPDNLEVTFRAIVLVKLLLSCHMPHAMCHMLLQAGGSMQQRKINDLSEIAQEFELVVNCAGLGSKELFKDDKLTAVRWVTVCAVAFVSTS